MQTVRETGYDEPRAFNPELLAEDMKSEDVLRVECFRAYKGDGRPTKALRRAWRKHKGVSHE